MVPVLLIALMTEVFIVYNTIQSFTVDLEVDWIFVLQTLIWLVYLVLPNFAAIYAGAITSEKVGFGS
jgi:hypothetical protein